MSQYVIYYNGAYNIFSTISDSCLFEPAVDRTEITRLLVADGTFNPEARISKARETGTSARTKTLPEMVEEYNLDLPREHQLTFDDFVSKYLTLPEREGNHRYTSPFSIKVGENGKPILSLSSLTGRTAQIELEHNDVADLYLMYLKAKGRVV